MYPPLLSDVPSSCTPFCLLYPLYCLFVPCTPHRARTVGMAATAGAGTAAVAAVVVVTMTMMTKTRKTMTKRTRTKR